MPKSSPRFEAKPSADNKDVPPLELSSDKTNRNILIEFEKSGGLGGSSHNKQTETTDTSHVLPKNTSDVNISKTLINKAFGKTDVVTSEKLEAPQTELNKLFDNLHITNENTPTSTPMNSEQITFKSDTPIASKQINFTIGEGSEMSQEILLNTDTSNQAELEAINQKQQIINNVQQEIEHVPLDIDHEMQEIEQMIQNSNQSQQVIDWIPQSVNQPLQDIHMTHQDINQAWRDTRTEVPVQQHLDTWSPLETIETLEELLQLIPPQDQKIIRDADKRARKALVTAQERTRKTPEALVQFVDQYYDIDPYKGNHYISHKFESKDHPDNNHALIDINPKTGIISSGYAYRVYKDKVHFSDLQRYTCVTDNWKEIPIHEYHANGVTNKHALEITRILYQAHIQATIKLGLETVTDGTLNFTRKSAAFMPFLGADTNTSMIFLATDLERNIQSVKIQGADAAQFIRYQFTFTLA